MNQHADRVVVIGYHQFRSIHAVNRGRRRASSSGNPVAGVIVHEANQAQRRQAAAGVIRVELSLPFRVTIEIRKRVVESAEVRIGIWGQGNIGWISYHCPGCVRIARQRNEIGGGAIARPIQEETIVANREARPQGVVPQIAGIYLIVRPIWRSHIGLAR